ncbi:TrmH family RNA methyltransferase [Treponema denticola]|jgi:RNA methyltransferase, trmH family|uniref:TrmH family RNA methyltransferase n=1 Tax=Treponema denticola TaxID=158 RepID=UPI0021F877BD|nr:TrmH family RNA methyltransferase [Treponema denticola]UYT07920.1 TrmH family RNA methyltransferase [Treponema denticola]
MPEIFKLYNLPQKQRCRKILRILESAETALVQNKADEFLDAFYLRSLLKIILDDLDSVSALKVQNWIEDPQEEDKRKIINFVRYELYKKLDTTPAEWDLILPNSSADEIANFRRTFFEGVYVYAEDIRTPFNIGSIFRTAESFGVEKVFLSHDCVSPDSPKAKRTAMGCTEYLPWERADLESLPDLPLIVLETGGTDISKFDFPKKGIVVIGSEELGVSPEAVKKAQGRVITIPMYGIKASINVSVAFGICMQKWCEALTAD